MFRSLRLLAALLLAVAVLVTATPALAGFEAAGAAGSGTRIVAVTARLQVESRSREATSDLLLVLPPVVLDRAGTQRVLAVSFLTEPVSTRDTGAGLEATYRFPRVAPGAVITIEQVYTVELRAQANVIIEDGVDPRYLQPEPKVESDAPAIRSRAEAITAGLETDRSKAEAIMRFVTRHIRYAETSGSRNQGALAGLTTGEGVCTEYANLFVAMARAVGIPARLVFGWARDTTLVGSLDGSNRHAWAEFYDPEAGWVPVEPTFAAALPLEQVMFFDGLNHVAQDWVEAPITGGYSGGALAFSPSYQLHNSGLTVAKAPVAPAPGQAPAALAAAPAAVAAAPAPAAAKAPAPTVASAPAPAAATAPAPAAVAGPAPAAAAGAESATSAANAALAAGKLAISSLRLTVR